jgi:hypothetical protein
MLMPTQRRAVKQIGLMLASITNESNFAFQTFQIFGIRIVMTAPSIARRFDGRNWIGRLRILRRLARIPPMVDKTWRKFAAKRKKKLWSQKTSGFDLGASRMRSWCSSLSAGREPHGYQGPVWPMWDFAHRWRREVATSCVGRSAV